LRTTEGTTGQRAELIEVFEYPASADAPQLASWSGWGGESDDGSEGEDAPLAAEAIVRAEYEHQLAEETRRSFEAGRERGRQEGHREERDAQKNAVTSADQQRVQQSAMLVERFAQERDRYLQAVEHEAVELALAIAARILRREAQMDPLMLTGAVRVALGQLANSTEVRLRVPPAELDLWGEAIALLPNLALKPVLVAAEGMQRGDCALEASLGSVDLGIRAQLAEIERGFFDRAGGQRVTLAGSLDNGNDMVIGKQKTPDACKENCA
jgi:flagellar assembly protein FliH